MNRVIAVISLLALCLGEGPFLGNENIPVPIPIKSHFSVKFPYYEKGMLVYLNSEGKLEVSLQPFDQPLATYDTTYSFSNLNMEEVDATVLRACAYDYNNIRVIDIIRGGANNNEITFVETFANAVVRTSVSNSWVAPHGWTYKRSLFYLSDQTIFWYNLESKELQGSHRVTSFMFNTHIHPYTEEAVWLVSGNTLTAFKFPNESYGFTVKSIQSDVPEAPNDVIRKIGFTDGLLFVLMHYSPEINVIDTKDGAYSQDTGSTITIPHGCIAMDASDSIAYLGCEGVGAYMIDANPRQPIIKEIVFNPSFKSSDYILKIYDDTVLMTDSPSVFSVYKNAMDGVEPTHQTTKISIPDYNYESASTNYHLSVTGIDNLIVSTNGVTSWMYKESQESTLTSLPTTSFDAAPGYVLQSFLNPTADELYTISYSNNKNYYTVFEKISQKTSITRKYTSDVLPRLGTAVRNSNGRMVIGSSTTVMEYWDVSFGSSDSITKISDIVVESVEGCSGLKPVALINDELFYTICSQLKVANLTADPVDHFTLAKIREVDTLTITGDAAGNIWIVSVGQSISLYQYNATARGVVLKSTLAIPQTTFLGEPHAVRAFYIAERSAVVVVYSFGLIVVASYDNNDPTLTLKGSWYTTGTIYDAQLPAEILYTYERYPAAIGKLSLTSAFAPAPETSPPPPPSQVTASLKIYLTGHSADECQSKVLDRTSRFLVHLTAAFGDGFQMSTFTISCTAENVIVQFQVLTTSDNNLKFTQEISTFENLLIGDSEIPTLEVSREEIIELPDSAPSLAVSFFGLVLCVVISLIL
eukprot:TRINITY_DN2145_c8_g1_i1.p1 TRINITY_DN2145_c8_g1~~TRINITY_DN2145_c8_g1_i1.p1  ORF type:complete len:812 (+),score=119.64 TRINITY_DN2145_c8_g1_i1:62-2497(+)